MKPTKVDQLIEELVDFDEYGTLCASPATSLDDIRQLARDLGIKVGKQTRTALCVQIGNLYKRMLHAEKEETDFEKAKQLTVNECMAKSKNVVDQVLELTYMRHPKLKKFPDWAVFRYNGYCCNLFDMLYLVSKNKLGNLPDHDIIKKKVKWIEKTVSPVELSKFMKRQSSVDHKSFQIAHFLSVLGVHIIPEMQVKASRPLMSKKRVVDDHFRFHKNFLKDYQNMVLTKRPNIKTKVVDHIDQIHEFFDNCKRFVGNISNGLSNVHEVQLKENLTDAHNIDTGGQQLVTLGNTVTVCDNRSAFDTNHRCCGRIQIKSGLDRNTCKRVLVHEICHVELHEQRAHPLQTKSQRSMTEDSRFEEGICVLAEFLAAGLGNDAKRKDFSRTLITDEYMQRFSCHSMIDEFGNETSVQNEDKGLVSFKKKYNSGFAHALSSMVTNGMSFAELFAYYIRHGNFPISKK